MAAQRFSRRWLLVAAGAAGLVGLGSYSPPAGAVDVDPERLRARIAGAPRPYVGYAESTGRLGLPEIPRLESVSQLLTTTTRIRAFVAGADRWRVDQVDNSGERDTYLVDGVEYAWDFGAQQLTRVVGRTPLRLPRAGDLAPPELARRIVRLAPTDPVTALPARRIAGRDAAGLRLTPTDPDTTVGRVDIWADVAGDPATALPLRVEVSARTGDPLLFTELLEVSDRVPDITETTPTVPPGAGFVAVGAADISGALRVLEAAPAPARLAGRDRVPLTGTPDAELPGVGLYGSGLAGFALIPVSGDVARQAIGGAGAAGGAAVEVPEGRAVSLSTPLLSVLVHGRRGGSVLMMGTVAPQVLERALGELSGRGPR
ncbi:hypothetical protein [Pseudonocardia lacus]|uniref:hypothetical protein n=1 Tax=Pseudonocardia lacus TaxID=2835865 RepID=UPI001BDBF414|nr:hypothetical protein [Pseudonocardia lacus]